jgi:2-polyprenyl-6-hydroxyphenyl methylase/3-demethylubiquinone-9 3-methyltransferase
MALLRNAVNPPRFAYFLERLERHFGVARLEWRGVDEARFHDEPFADTQEQLSVLDVGCGGGLLAERFAAIGCDVTGVDRSLPTLDAACDHARSMGLNIT